MLAGRGCAFRLSAPVRFRLVALLSIPSPGDPFLINSGPIHARWYGLLLALGVLLAGWIARREFRRRSIDAERAYRIGVWVRSPRFPPPQDGSGAGPPDPGVGDAVRPVGRPPLPRGHRLGRVKQQ